MEVQVELPDWMRKWFKPEVFLGGIVLILALALAVLWFSWRWSIAEDRMDMMQAQADEGFLQAPSSSRTVRLDPRRGSSTATVGGGDAPERIDLAINAPSDRFDRFRVSIVRDDGTLVMHADRVLRDSNLDLRISFNSSVLAPGTYKVRIEGIERNGAYTRYAEAVLRAAGR